MNQIQGTSSLLFLISTIKAIYCSKLILWKIFNGFLIIASYLCNASNYEPQYLFLDYSTIFLVSSSYVNNAAINSFLVASLLYEYSTTRSIENSKNAAFASAVSKSILYTYLYVDKIHFYVILTSSISGVIIYKIRYNLHKNNNRKYIIPLTYLFHICITNIMYISSITAK